MSKIIEYDKTQDLKQGKKLIQFSASWCGPCRMIKPKIEELSEEFETVEFIYVDIDNHQGLASKYAVRSVPMIFIVEDGDIKDQIIGADIPKIRTALESIK